MKIDIRQIDKHQAIGFIFKYHYSKILPRLTKLYLGYFEGARLVGVVTLGWGTQPKHTIKKIFYKHNYDTKDYLEIGKMCFLPEKNKTNFGSQAIAGLIRWIKINLDIKFLYTLADGIMGKCGFVYQASNFIYIGKFKTSIYMDRKTKEKIHPRSAKSLCKENAIFENKDKIFWLSHDFCEYKGLDKINGLMFRYIYPLDKKSREVVNNYKEFNELKNPKFENLSFHKRTDKGKFEQIEQPVFDMDVFNHNFQKGEDKSYIQRTRQEQLF